MPSSLNTRRLPTEPFIPNESDSARQPHWEELPNMERNVQDELKAHLMATNEEFHKLADMHSDYAHRLDVLESLPHPTIDEELEEKRLKKAKLHLKDQMEAIMSQNRSQQ